MFHIVLVFFLLYLLAYLHFISLIMGCKFGEGTFKHSSYRTQDMDVNPEWLKTRYSNKSGLIQNDNI